LCRSVGRHHRAKGRQLGRRLLLVEHVERPVAGCACLRVRVVRSRAVIGADDDRADPGGVLLGPRQSPDRLDATAAALYACCGHLAGAEQQVGVDLLQCLPGARIEQVAQTAIVAAASCRALPASALTGNHWSGSRLLSAHRACLMTRAQEA
jgi:hypothetical protein